MTVVLLCKQSGESPGLASESRSKLLFSVVLGGFSSFLNIRQEVVDKMQHFKSFP